MDGERGGPAGLQDQAGAGLRIAVDLARGDKRRAHRRGVGIGRSGVGCGRARDGGGVGRGAGCGGGHAGRLVGLGRGGFGRRREGGADRDDTGGWLDLGDGHLTERLGLGGLTLGHGVACDVPADQGHEQGAGDTGHRTETAGLVVANADRRVQAGVVIGRLCLEAGDYLVGVEIERLGVGAHVADGEGP